MKRSLKLLLIFPFGLFACANEKEVSNPVKVFSTAHFDFYYENISNHQLMDLGRYIEDNYARLLDHMGVTSTTKIAIHFYADNAHVRSGSGQANFPSWSIGLATARDQIHMISPYNGSVSYDINNIVHEVAHCISMYINPRIPNNPRWLWESIAIYESGQFVDPRRLGYLKIDPPGSLTEFDNVNNTRIYEVGFLISEFVVEKWGKQKLMDLIRLNGNTNEVLGLPDKAFVDEWLKAVREKYGL